MIKIVGKSTNFLTKFWRTVLINFIFLIQWILVKNKKSSRKVNGSE